MCLHKNESRKEIMQSHSGSISSFQHPISILQRWLLVSVVLVVTTLVSSRAKADLDTRIMYSIEWLVDESDTIVIVRDPQNPGEGNPKVIKCIKGNEASIVWPLTLIKTRWPDYKNCVPPSDGPVRLLFIRGSSLLLQEVSLGRKRAIPAIRWSEFFSKHDPIPIAGISQTLYGVTQFGDLLLTESSLFEAIEARLKSVRVPIKARPDGGNVYALNSVDFGMSEGKIFAWSNASDEFPLNHSDEHYSIIVPCDTHRRDYYLNQLKNGFVSEKRSAIRQLGAMMDTEAHAAIRVAVKSDEIELGYSKEGTVQEIGPWNSVHFAAIEELEHIDKHRDKLFELLASPQATDKIDAISDLVYFNDPLAVDAICQATQTPEASPHINIDAGTTVDVQAVREAAAKALQQIERDRFNGMRAQ